MNVSVYTRHRSSCPHRDKANYNKCHCPKAFHWYTGGRLYRRTAETDDHATALQKAEEFRRELEGTGSPPAGRQTILAAVVAYIKDKQAQQLSGDTISKLCTIFSKQFCEFCQRRSLTLIDQITLAHLQEWRSEWKDAALAASKKQERVRGFFYFCVRMGWLKQNPAVGLSKIKVTQKPTLSFTEDQMETILEAAKRDFNPKLYPLILTMRWAGLAIRDAVTLERTRLHDDDTIFLYRAKTGVPVSVAIQSEVAKEIRSVRNGNPAYFFWSGNGLPKSAVADYQRSLRRLFKRINLKENGQPKRCYPHMFRNTFSVSLLLQGVGVENVALLLGHSSTRTTEKAYSPFVEERRAELLAAVRRTWTSKVTVAIDQINRP